MATRKQLEEMLTAQRARRMKHSIPGSHKKSGGLSSALLVLVILAASGIAMSFAVRETTPKEDVTVTASTTPSVASSTSMATTAPAAPVAMQICTHIPNGRLHVRFAAGDGSEVRGYLAEGETVQLAPTPSDKAIPGEEWLPISYPIAGWVNARFVCKQEK